MIGPRNISNRTSANGVWTLNEAAEQIGTNTWPTAQDPLISSVIHLAHGNSVINVGVPISSVGSQVASWRGTNTSTRSTTGAIFPGQSFITSTVGDGVIVGANTGFGSADFTVEMFFRVGTLGTAQNIIDWRPAGTNGAYGTIYLNASPATVGFLENNTTRITSASAVTTGVTYHLVYQRQGGNLGTLAINGVSVGTWADTTSYTNNGGVGITYGGSIFNGNSGATSGFVFDELRLTQGVARYTFPFTVPTARFPDW